MLEVPIVDTSYEAVPVFPLPNFVIFPQTMTRLHIFEPRYRLMAAEALATSRLIVLVGLKPGWEADYYGSPPVYEIGSLCKIVNEERLDDGRYNLFVHCLARVELTTMHRLLPYRTASVTVRPDVGADAEKLAETTERLQSVVRGLMLRLGENATLLANVLASTKKPVILGNRLAAALVPDAVERQQLLETVDPVQRAEKLCDLAGDLLLHSEQPQMFGGEFDAALVN